MTQSIGGPRGKRKKTRGRFPTSKQRVVINDGSRDLQTQIQGKRQNLLCTGMQKGEERGREKAVSGSIHTTNPFSQDYEGRWAKIREAKLPEKQMQGGGGGGGGEEKGHRVWIGGNTFS